MPKSTLPLLLSSGSCSTLTLHLPLITSCFSMLAKSLPPLHILFPFPVVLRWFSPTSHRCPPDPSPAHADSRCSLTLLALLPSPLPSTTDMHKHTPAGNNRGLIQGGHAADPAGPLSRTVIWTWAAAMQRPQCC